LVFVIFKKVGKSFHIERLAVVALPKLLLSITEGKIELFELLKRLHRYSWGEDKLS
jgi:hypothetical protein